MGNKFKINSLFANMKIDKFVLSMLFAVFVSFIFPQWGGHGSKLHLDLITKWGVAIVFFLHGANLSIEAIKSGAFNWRLHIYTQSITFVIFPIFGFIIFYSTSEILPFSLRLGIFFLCALSSTISSSITLTGIANGNVAGAVFNASLSGILGMIITPFLISLILKANQTIEFDTFGAMIEIAKTLLLPFAFGQLLRPIIKNILVKHKKIIVLIDRSIIVLIVFVAFCNANLEKIWQKTSVFQLFSIFLIVFFLLALILWLNIKIANKLNFSHANKTAGVFVGATKSLANGAPIAAILFAGNPQLGMILLPIMLYHQLQLIICAILAAKWAEPNSIQ